MPHGPRGGEGKMALPYSVVSENQMSGKYHFAMNGKCTDACS